MPDEHNVFDLSELLADRPFTGTDTPKIDTSGRPAPVNVRVQLNSGVVVKCDCRYQGINPADGARLFLVIAEIDWENYFPKRIIVDEMPRDAELRFRVPGMTNEEASQACAQAEFIAQRIVG